MSETSDQLLRGFQAQEKRFVERRFPLRFASENPTLRELYRQAKRLPLEPGDRHRVEPVRPRRRTRRRCARPRAWCGAAGPGARTRGWARTPRC